MNKQQHIASHRCPKLLRHNKDNLSVFIRYGWRYLYSWAVPSEKRGWHIYNVETNYKTGREYSHYITTIKYCPFCGEELKDELYE